jgi:hypothetical protein
MTDKREMIEKLEGRDFAEMVAVDPDDLHEECAAHPAIYWQVARASAHAKKVADRAREKKKVTRSELIKQVQKSPGDFGLKSATAQTVEAAYRAHPDYIAAVDEVIDAEYRESMLINAVYAMNQRNRALEGLIALYKSNYFASQAGPRNVDPGKRQPTFADQARTDAADRSRSRVNRKRFRRD